VTTGTPALGERLPTIAQLRVVAGLVVPAPKYRLGGGSALVVAAAKAEADSRRTVNSVRILLFIFSVFKLVFGLSRAGGKEEPANPYGAWMIIGTCS
jgi:hypothetical protein